MTKYACPHCDGHIKAGPEWAGRKIKCPHCSGMIDFPARPASIAIGSATVQPLLVPVPVQPEPLQSDATKTSGIDQPTPSTGIYKSYLSSTPDPTPSSTPTPSQASSFTPTPSRATPSKAGRPVRPPRQGPAPVLNQHRLMQHGLLHALRAPDEWRVFHRMLIAGLVLGGAAMGWLLYLLRESPEIISIGAVCVGSWLLTLTAMLMVGRRKLVKFWAALFALVSLAGVLACGRILLGDSPEYEGARLPALIVGVGVVAMLIVCSEALCVKRLVPKSTRAKVLQA